MILEWIRLTVAVLTLGASLLPAGPVTDVSQGHETVLDTCSLTTERGEIPVKESRFETGEKAAVTERTYTIYNGDTVCFGSAWADESLDNVCVATVELPGDRGMIRWYDAQERKWDNTTLRNADVTAGCVVVSAGDSEALLYTPKVYRPVCEGTLERKPEIAGGVRVRVEEGRCTLQLIAARIPKRCQAEYTVVRSEERLFRWSAATEEAWRACTMDNDRLWCSDGCYHPTPDNYDPTGENFYYRIPAGYFCRLVGENAPAIRAAEDMVPAMLDVMSRQQNEDGYFPTLPKSNWLSGDYGIGGGFYDTRFNSDLAEVFYAASWLGSEAHLETMNRYFDFYLNYAQAHHTKTENGILVYDYHDPRSSAPVHTSLNHHLAEALTLYHWAQRLERPALGELADRMVRGVEDTAELWIREDGNLHYAVYPGSGYGGQDYPFLTYNDLYAMVEYLQGQGRDTSRLQRIMDAKHQWMEANGVTGYRR